MTPALRFLPDHLRRDRSGGRFGPESTKSARPNKRPGRPLAMFAGADFLAQMNRTCAAAHSRKMDVAGGVGLQTQSGWLLKLGIRPAS